MVEPVESDEMITPPAINEVSHGQRQANPAEQRALVATQTDSAYLSDSLSGIVADQGRLQLNEAGGILLATASRIMESSLDAARRELITEKKSREGWEKRAHEGELRAARAEERLRDMDLRLLSSNLGSVLLGLIPFAYEKAQLIGSLIAGLIGAALITGSFLIGRKGPGE